MHCEVIPLYGLFRPFICCFVSLFNLLFSKRLLMILLHKFSIAFIWNLSLFVCFGKMFFRENHKSNKKQTKKIEKRNERKKHIWFIFQYNMLNINIFDQSKEIGVVGVGAARCVNNSRNSHTTTTILYFDWILWYSFCVCEMHHFQKIKNDINFIQCVANGHRHLHEFLILYGCKFLSYNWHGLA